MRKPRSVEFAVLLMYAGAALAVLDIVLTLSMSDAIKDNLKSRMDGTVSSARLDDAFSSFNTQAVVGGVIGIVLWVAMARFNDRGLPWARVVATVLFGISTLRFLSQLLSTPPIPLFAVVFLTWLVGLSAVIYLWRPESSEYFRPTAQDR